MEIVVLGRRGPVQAAFTNPELRELGEMADADIHVDLGGPRARRTQPFLPESEADITARKNVEILNEFKRKEPEGKPRRIVLLFLASPIEIQGDGRVERVVVGRNELHRDEPALRARDSGERETIEAGLVLRSIGYKGAGRRHPVRRSPRRDPQRGRPSGRSRSRRAHARSVRGRVDQRGPSG